MFRDFLFTELLPLSLASEARLREFYRSNVVLNVVSQLSPGARQAAAARWLHCCGSVSAAGRLCHGSMHTNRTGFAGADQMSA